MKKLSLALVLTLFGISAMLAQRTIMGTVSGDDGSALIGATVLVKGTSTGTITDIDGKYSLRVTGDGNILVFSFTGFSTAEVPVGASNVLDVTLKSGQVLEEVVVTALGVSRYKNELAYSAQKVEGDEMTNTRDANVVNALSGRVAGLSVKRNNSLGGSTNIVLRGSKSLTGDNQALFVIDGVPVDNSNTNLATQQSARGGYDYGNAANDINADDIESITVLKGAAASALYGSRASNGVVMINTKKGSKAKGLGVSVNTGVNFGKIDKTTFVEFQDKYGGGYGGYYEDPTGKFLYRDINGDGTDDLVTPTSEDASWGARFDPNLLVYQWDAFDPSSPNYGKPTPWVAAKNGPDSYFETSVGTSNSVMIDGTNDNGFFKLGYTRTTDKGLLPNSQIDKNLVNFSAAYDLTKKLHVNSSINFTSTDGTGRYGTGYDSKNQMGSFRQWWQVNVDVKDQKDAYDRTGQNVTWNWADPTDLVPIYWDNTYWVRYENFSTDHRNRYFGYLSSTYNVTPWFDVIGRVSLDQYSEIQEERIAVGSVDVSEYQRFNRNYQEVNYDLMGQFKDINLADGLRFNALIGTNIRKQSVASIRAKTNGGLSLPNLYSLTNSKNPIEAPVETQTDIEVDGVFAQAGLVYNNWAILDLTGRRDQASTLPAGNNIYYYPSASLGIIFSRLMGESDAFTFGKLRLNYAEVGNTAPWGSVTDVYNLGTAFGNAPTASVATTATVGSGVATKNNPDLKPERTKSYEGGLELRFLKDMLGFDITYYKMNTIDQILPATISRSSGYSAKFINAGDVENRGWEVQMFLRPVNTPDFKWRMDLNWARNRNEVLSLGGIDNLQLAAMQGGVTVNASVGEAYGTIKGKDFVYYDANGNGERDAGENDKVVNASGYYVSTTSSAELLGNINPDWTGGMNNTFSFGNLSLSFLIDVKKGGDVFSLDQYYGLATGEAKETAGLNDLGNEVRAPLDQGGGIIVEGVLADGTPNTNRYDATNFGIYGYRRNPNAAFVYDASFVKLREATLNYNFPKSMFAGSNVIKGATIGVYGRNLWIIHKNLPNADPEDGMSAGNVQGYQSGSYPTARVFGVNLNVKF
ncbi:MAG: SusC/RagA family TonB-linked outer membrane protein [Saprospiraceae bacterium]|nr:SusC/RagA family TonB-linked outer membrane protein [Saprospiraceae bacterium]MCF8251584.1 SusC/RagA family TonB-linked outer membrane protein [Saprospiraceae bacterium]MCF8282046.1 SusC/RagA family TonB-linked outer membrane protein [Bacteroidales bacterium]MCF8313479.1 SusC/RagA family TonB-linked outer membrane protein [Saprospiraceae bacterium]MCF8442220.1 SusC/RagA family TonB-linked outer membrane protein [Saprospiraceae bacterium]